MRVGRLLFPALRWKAETGFGHEAEVIDAGLELGVGGFILFGGEAPAVRELVTELRTRSAVPLLVGADLERGAGQQFAGATPLPPLAALGALDDLAVTRRAAELTAREARALGVNWIYAPVADLDLDPRNPIVGTRAFGSDAARVAAHVAAWIEGCRAGGALSCAKHFPGHGRTVEDSHVRLPRVDASPDELETDLAPFRAAIAAQVDSMMTAHVAFPALDATGTAATLSAPILTDLLRKRLAFDGLVVTDALIMEGVLEAGQGEADAAVLALAAGCDALLYPADLRGVHAAVQSALGNGLPQTRGLEAALRIDEYASRANGPPGGEWGADGDVAWALDVALRTLQAVRGRPGGFRGEIDLVSVDDDVGGPYPPGPRTALPDALREGGLTVHEAQDPSGERPALVALYADIRAWKGRPGISEKGVAALRRALERQPEATVALFGHPRLAADVPGPAVLAAWGGEPLMQRAAARWLLAGGRSGREGGAPV